MGAPTSLSSYNHVAETKENLDWADLPTIDLSLVSTSEGKRQLAQTLIEAIRTFGFFYVKNFNISQERVNRQFAIGQAFYELPLEEKLKYVPDLDNGQYNGYRPAGRRIIQGGLRDRTEVYNIPKFNGDFPQNHPAPVADHIEEIEEFARSLHSEVLDPLHTLIALALELPEDYFTSRHRYEDKSEDHLRYMKYSKYTAEETKQIGGIWGQGHTDLGTITLLFRQPVAALQIKDHLTGQWKWVKPQDGTLTVNTCDALSFLTGGYIKSTIHRVAAPPKDQQHVDRLGLLYFARPRNDLVLSTVDSPVLKREGYTQNEFEREGVHVPTMEEFTFSKQKWQQAQGEYKDGATILPGFKGQIFK
ncbi:flavonol synthase [Punctularia strigosozonata HHB-11173 SS5]|uniref:flavonol synthase n=1 Tax=Punctularia strigosozonata (strain HHB-11173) TaxID=741275 RepID=UPI0004416E67|nr:flavonol synthase [Punctularia strigosozonata HHB-11173 SS5]EIN14527.1 flavonol synthase [Punctularia strigosozonata HHB-11173 SS5]